MNIYYIAPYMARAPYLHSGWDCITWGERDTLLPVMSHQLPILSRLSSTCRVVKQIISFGKSVTIDLCIQFISLQPSIINYSFY